MEGTLPTAVYYFPLNKKMEEGDPIEVSLVERDGRLVADLSKLPEPMRRTLEGRGVPDALHRDSVLPTDGPTFLAALLRESNAYRRFRSSPTPVKS
ncbi:MAG: hypothetical protein AAB668_03560 [Patescibacteria group bacterium]